MTTDDEILKELKEHTKLMRAEVAILSEIKFELQNARMLAKPQKIPTMWERVQYWLRGKTRK